MKPETMEWIAKGDADFATAKREAAVLESPNYDAACFHAQQCTEKYLKGVLVENGLRVPRIHDLEALINQLLPLYPSLIGVMRFARILSAMAVEVRYPGMSADEDDATESVKAAIEIRSAVRLIFECGKGR